MEGITGFTNFSRMDNFIVSARKYRPETFASVVGQAAVTETLKSAIQKKQLGHAYLFCGPRGVGKTTCARIFAKTVNCINPGAEADPCNQCESCLSFNESRAFNIHELDAASNNKVDDIRNLIDQVRIPPQVGNYSIYIIDEVHMLSAAAFNSFLKTLEEPPPHAIFILATTEKHKIIPTILSRCQIFDFNRIRVEDITGYLEFIAGKEGVDFEPDAFALIAQKADGAMRDALSIFDQMVSFSGKTIRYKDVIENLNILDYEYYFRLTEACFAGHTGEALLIFEEILSRGFDAQNFLSGLGSHMRDLLVCLDEATLSLLEVGAGIRERYLAMSKKLNQEWLYGSLELLGSVDVSFRASRNQRLHVELAILRLCRLQEEAKKKVPHPGEEPGEKALTEPEENAAQEKEPSREPHTGINSETVPAKEIFPQPGSEADSKPAEEEKTDAAPQDTKENKEDPGGGGGNGSSAGGQETVPDAGKPTERRKEGHLLSIKDALNGVQEGKKKEKAEDSAVERKVLSEAFGQEDLIRHWVAFTESILVQKPRMANSLKHHLPSLGDALQIELVLSNTAQLEEFNRDIKPLLTEYLENALQNNQFRLLPTVAEEEKAQNTLYTPEEKYKHMLKKNPELGKLKERFNLDFE